MDLRDQLANVGTLPAQVAAFSAVDKLQNFHPAEQVAGAAMLFVMLVRRFGADARDVLAQTDRRIEDALKDPRYLALRQYLGEELR